MLTNSPLTETTCDGFNGATSRPTQAPRSLPNNNYSCRTIREAFEPIDIEDGQYMGYAGERCR